MSFSKQPPEATLKNWKKLKFNRLKHIIHEKKEFLSKEFLKQFKDSREFGSFID